MAQRFTLYGILTLSILVALGSWRFLGLGFELSFPDFGDHLIARRMAFILHVSVAPLALVLGGFQFLPGLRARRPRLHRWSGRIYAACVLVGGVAGILLAVNASGGVVAGAGFGLLGVFWLGTTGKALLHALKRQIEIHREWMIRSFALTLAGVTLRLYLAGFLVSGVGYIEASPWLAWFCWVPNAVIAELWIARSRRRRPVPARAS
ncbi:DUF2306 domain-containing protein [Tateyamaria pelophila]|uniref:DUF2306 domain-containing protein n=1 Tax=Tateyamaria pelophila TaxID=328415 RepID=UPI001CC0DD82|nr:DUF2306 domain-containing protein [Tateyamaria pelophila]